MTRKMLVIVSETKKRVLAFLLIAITAILVVLARESDFALLGVFVFLISFYIFLFNIMQNNKCLKDVCDFYDRAHSLSDIQILQQARPYKHLLEAVTDLGNFDWAVLFLMDFDNNRFVAAEADGMEISRFSCIDFDQLNVNTDSTSITLSSELLEYAFKKHDFRGALAGSTIERNNAFYGCLLVGREGDNEELNEEDGLRLNILSDQISICLHNYYLYKEMAEHIKDFSEQRDRVKRELKMARVVQEGVMARDVPLIKHLEVASYWNPSHLIGGDFLRFLKDDNTGRLGILIGDVSGKGIPAALVMAVVVCLFEEKASLDKPPCKLLDEMNVSLKDFLGIGSRFNSSAFWGILNSNKMTFRYASAGHDFPLHLIAKTREFNELTSTGTLLGIFRESQFKGREIAVEDGDKIVFYSDGLIDFFEFDLGYEDGYKALQEFIRDRYSKTSQEIVNEIAELVDAKKKPTKDDITVAVFSVTKTT